MNYDPTAYERFDVFYRDDSVERLAETVRNTACVCAGCVPNFTKHINSIGLSLFALFLCGRALGRISR